MFAIIFTQTRHQYGDKITFLGVPLFSSFEGTPVTYSDMKFCHEILKILRYHTVQISSFYLN